MWSIVVDDCIVWASVSLSVMLISVLTHSPDVATSMQPLLLYRGHLLGSCIKIIRTGVMQCKSNTG